MSTSAPFGISSITTPSNVSAEFAALKTELLTRENELRQYQAALVSANSHTTPVRSSNRPLRQAASAALNRVRGMERDVVYDDADEDEEEAVPDEDDDDDDDDSSLEYKPRKSHRARARDSDDEDDLDDYSDMERIDRDLDEDYVAKSKSRKPRGRPRKNPAANPVAEGAAAIAAALVTDENGEVIKRGRGRPRKYPLQPPAPPKPPRTVSPSDGRAKDKLRHARLDGKACALLTTGACGVVDQGPTGRVNIRMDADGELVTSGASRIYVFKEWTSDEDAIQQIIEATKFVPQLQDLTDGTRVCVVTEQEQTAVVDGDEANDPKSPTKAMVRVKFDVSRVTANIPLENLRLIPANHRALGPLPKKGAGRPSKAEMEERGQSRVSKFLEPASKNQAWRDALVAPKGGPRNQSSASGTYIKPRTGRDDEDEDEEAFEEEDEEGEEGASRKRPAPEAPEAQAPKRVDRGEDDESVPTALVDLREASVAPDEQRAAIARQQLANRQQQQPTKSRYDAYDDEEDEE